METFNIKTSTKAECLVEANRWLEKGIGFEESGKPTKYTDMSLNKAVKFEEAALDGRK